MFSLSVSSALRMKCEQPGLIACQIKDSFAQIVSVFRNKHSYRSSYQRLSPKSRILKKIKGKGTRQRVVHTALSPFIPPNPEHEEEDIWGLRRSRSKDACGSVKNVCIQGWLQRGKKNKGLW